MDIISLSPLRTASLVWQPKPGNWMLTVLCKATFNLTPIQSELASEQDPVIEFDDHWNDDERRSLHFASELIPMKSRAEVVIVGQAFAPNGQPARSITAGFSVGNVEKSIEVMCDRHFTHDGALQEGQRFTRMPLVYERASGGPGTWNPSGIRHGARDPYGRTSLPNLQPRGMLVRSPDDFVEPIGFGPMAPNWPARRDKLGPHAASFSAEPVTSAPLPDGFNYAFFNTVLPDQWVEGLRDNERIILDNLHPEYSRLVTSLPGVHPRAFVEGREGGPQAIEMRADTLFIDTDRGVCSLLFRGFLALSRPDEAGRVLVAMEQPQQALTYADVARLAGEGRGDSGSAGLNILPHFGSRPVQEEMHTLVAINEPGPPTLARSIPFGQPAASSAFDEARASKPSSGLPFSFSSGGQPALPSTPAPSSAPSLTPGTMPPPPPASRQPRETATMPFPPGGGPPGAAPGNLPRFMTESGARPPPAPPAPPGPPPLARQAMPFQPAAGPPMSAPPMSAQPPSLSAMPFQPVGAPPMTPPPMNVAGEGSARPVAPPAPVAMPFTAKSAAPVSSSPWASGALPSGAGVGAAASVALAAPALAPALRGPGGNIPGSATAASDAAADASTRTGLPDVVARPAPPPPSPSPSPEKAQRAATGDVLDLIWYDEAHVPRIRAWWEELVTDLDFEASDPRRDLGAEDPEKAKSRHNVFGIMSDGVMVDNAGISRVIAEAVGQKGRFTPPLALMGGELRFLFDEVETLRATIVAITPLVGNDKRLKETIDSMNELLKTPYLQGSTGVVEKLTKELRDQFRESNRAVPIAQIDSHVERLMLEQRHYNTRKVFGGEFIRALLGMSPASSGSSGGASGGSSSTSEPPIPVYLPKHLDQTLPMLVVMKARLIVAAHLQQDAYDTSPYALRAVALGRSFQLDAWRGAASGSGSGKSSS